MMAILGWIVCVIVMCKVSLAAFFVAINCLGDYNIGGATNSSGTKLKTMLFIAVVAVAWYAVAVNAPFTLGMK